MNEENITYLLDEASKKAEIDWNKAPFVGLIGLPRINKFFNILYSLIKSESKHMKVSLKKLYPDVQTPTYATDGSGAFDIRAYMPDQTATKVFAGCAFSFATGLTMKIPEGFGLLILSRSGHGFKNRTRLSNAVGLIDSDYTGEIRVSLHADEDGGIVVNHGDRIAQGLLVALPRVEFEEVDELPTTVRGTGGFGSTGA